MDEDFVDADGNVRRNRATGKTREYGHTASYITARRTEAKKSMTGR